MSISKNSVVSMTYTVKDDSGTTLDTNAQGDPFSFIHGVGNIIPGLDKEMKGKSEGDTFSVTVTPEEGYGVYDESMVFTLPKATFREPEKIEPGMSVQFESKEGTRISIIKDINEEEVVLDGNHPLAGQKLHFDIEITGVRDATEEELEHGHTHG